MAAIPIPREPLADFCRRWRVAELSLFGSAARGDVRPDSDVDVLLAFEPDAPWSLFDLVTMQDELRAIFGRPVDLVEREALRNLYRRQAILTSREVLYAAWRARCCVSLGYAVGGARSNKLHLGHLVCL